MAVSKRRSSALVMRYWHLGARSCQMSVPSRTKVRSSRSAGAGCPLGRVEPGSRSPAPRRRGCQEADPVLAHRMGRGEGRRRQGGDDSGAPGSARRSFQATDRHGRYVALRVCGDHGVQTRSSLDPHIPRTPWNRSCQKPRIDGLGHAMGTRKDCPPVGYLASMAGAVNEGVGCLGRFIDRSGNARPLRDVKR